ncbi:MAG: HNH endonuclease [Bryobacteraceae bacterium]
MAFEPARLISYDRETLLTEIKRVLAQIGAGRASNHREFNRLSRVHSATIVKQFGSWEAAMRAAGVDYARSGISASDLKEDLGRVFEKSGGKYFTQKFYRQAGGRYSWTTLKKRLHCTNWVELLEKVLHVRRAPRVIARRVRARRRPTPGKRTQLTPESLLSELRATAAKSSSEALSYTEYRALGGSYSIGSFQKHVGRWRDAVHLIGLADGYSHRRAHLTFTNEDLFSEMQRMWEILGRQPKSREMKQSGSRMSAQAFADRFGSWMRAVHAFCADRARSEDRPWEPPPVAKGELAGDTQTSMPVPEQSREHIAGGPLVIHKATPRAPSLRLRFKVFQRDRFACRACGRSPATESGVVLQVDHIVPYSGPGETTLDNLQTLCGQCNLGKSDSPPNSE